MKEIKYKFQYVDDCNMCKASSIQFKILGQRQNRTQGKNPKKNIAISTQVQKCNNCGLIFSNPQPIPLDINDHYGVPPENYWKEEYFKIDENYNITMKNFFSSKIDIKEGAKALDIGAGIGKLMNALTYMGFDTYGLEPSKPFIDKAISKMEIREDRLKHSTVEDADYPENSFDLITINAVLEHVYNPDSVLKKLLYWTKPGGYIQIEVPSSKWLIHKLGNLYYKLRLKDYVVNLSPMHNPYHLYEFSVKSFILNSKINNYKVDSYNYWLGQTFMPKITDKFFKYIMKKTNTGMEISVFLKKLVNV